MITQRRPAPDGGDARGESNRENRASRTAMKLLVRRKASLLCRANGRLPIVVDDCGQSNPFSRALAIRRSSQLQSGPKRCNGIALTIRRFAYAIGNKGFHVFASSASVFSSSGWIGRKLAAMS